MVRVDVEPIAGVSVLQVYAVICVYALVFAAYDKAGVVAAFRTFARVGVEEEIVGELLTAGGGFCIQEVFFGSGDDISGVGAVVEGGAFKGEAACSGGGRASTRPTADAMVNFAAVR